MNEYKLVEKPAVEQLEGLGYEYVSRGQVDEMRADESARSRGVGAAREVAGGPSVAG